MEGWTFWSTVPGSISAGRSTRSPAGCGSPDNDAERIHKVRRASKVLITIGACATAGGIQALKNLRDTQQLVEAVYAHPEYIDTLDTSTPVQDHVPVDLELRGCPIDKRQLLEVLPAEGLDEGGLANADGAVDGQIVDGEGLAGGHRFSTRL